MKDAKEKKVFGFGIKLRIIADIQSSGYTDINDYIDALKARIKELEAQQAAPDKSTSGAAPENEA